jgi:hypothetical protein
MVVAKHRVRNPSPIQQLMISQIADPLLDFVQKKYGAIIMVMIALLIVNNLLIFGVVVSFLIC